MVTSEMREVAPSKAAVRMPRMGVDTLKAPDSGPVNCMSKKTVMVVSVSMTFSRSTRDRFMMGGTGCGFFGGGCEGLCLGALVLRAGVMHIKNEFDSFYVVRVWPRAMLLCCAQGL